MPCDTQSLTFQVRSSRFDCSNHYGDDRQERCTMITSFIKRLTPVPKLNTPSRTVDRTHRAKSQLENDRISVCRRKLCTMEVNIPSHRSGEAPASARKAGQVRLDKPLAGVTQQPSRSPILRSREIHPSKGHAPIIWRLLTILPFSMVQSPTRRLWKSSDRPPTSEPPRSADALILTVATHILRSRHSSVRCALLALHQATDILLTKSHSSGP